MLCAAKRRSPIDSGRDASVTAPVSTRRRPIAGVRREETAGSYNGPVADQHQGFAAYCEAIYELAEDEVDVIQARIADRLGVSRPAVSEMIRRMTAEGLVRVDGTIQLTDEGVALAERIVRRHRLAERFLTDILELSWADAHRQANRWEHVIDENVEVAMDRVLGSPTTCPHGNPIPGSDYRETEAVPLAELDVGATFTVTRIPEELEFTPGVLDFLEE